jgi:anti-anti-sigma factor
MIQPDDEVAIEVVHGDGPAPVVVLRGEFDLAVVDRLSGCLADLAASYPSEVTVDMAAVSFFDSTSLAALLHASRRLEAQGGTLVVVRPSAVVRTLLEITNLSRTFGVPASPDGEALDPA